MSLHILNSCIPPYALPSALPAILQAQDIMPAEPDFFMAGSSSSSGTRRSDARRSVKPERTTRPASEDPNLNAGVKTESGRTVKAEAVLSLGGGGGVIELFSDSEDERNPNVSGSKCASSERSRRHSRV